MNSDFVMSILRRTVRTVLLALSITAIVILPVRLGFSQTIDLNPPFPRIAQIQYGSGTTLTDPQRMAVMKKADLVFLGVWPGWGPFDGMTMADVVEELRTANPNMIIAPYTNVTESKDSRPDVPDKLTEEKGPNGRGDWWLRTASGERTSHWPGNNSANFSMWVTPDRSGLRLPEWYADYMHSEVVNKAAFNAVFSDVVSPRSKVTADWNGDGVDDAKDSQVAITAVTEGHVAYIERWNSLEPEFIKCGNVGGWFHPNPSRVMPEAYNQFLDCGFIEGIMGHNWSIETWGTWDQMMNKYRSIIEFLRAPKIVIFNTHANSTDYQMVRYGLASALLDDGYFAVDPADRGDYTWQYWYDEFDVELGYPVDAPPTSPWKQGVYRREFDNGLVLVNPKGNGTQVLTLESGWKRFVGQQDPAHNDGTAVTELTLADSDGILLVRENSDGPAPKAPPEPPSWN